MPKYAKQRDGNEPDIVTALRDAGAVVCRIGDFGIPDLLVGYQGKTFLLEVKLPLERGVKKQHREAEGGRGDFTKAQVKWWDSWHGAPAFVVRSPADALAAIGAA